MSTLTAGLPLWTPCTTTLGYPWCTCRLAPGMLSLMNNSGASTTICNRNGYSTVSRSTMPACTWRASWSPTRRTRPENYGWWWLKSYHCPTPCPPSQCPCWSNLLASGMKICWTWPKVWLAPLSTWGSLNQKRNRLGCCMRIKEQFHRETYNLLTRSSFY